MSKHPTTDSSNTMLPIDEILPQILHGLENGHRLIIQAPPGAGKSTKVPLALLDADWFTSSASNQQIWLLEPRRLAAQQVAQRMASTIGEPVGQTVGLITGQQTKLSANTKLVVMTEAILCNKLLADEDIPDCAAILFDEFHERNLFSDLGLALSVESQQLLREDLKLVVMSATLSTESLQSKLDADILTSEGRSYPVQTHYLGTATSQHKTLEEHCAGAIRQALVEESGHILVFLPGMAEIRRTQSLLEEKGLPDEVHVLPLHGQLPAQEQKKALDPLPATSSSGPTGRKVILATSVAETSLTIDGVRVVIDSGVERSARFNVRTAMDQLTTLPSSQASAEQRRGRAGRQQSGACYRLWSEDSHSSREPFSAPDVLTMDLAGFALTLACWGSLSLEDYLLLDQPNQQRWSSAVNLLKELNAITKNGQITDHGRAMATLGLHPRLAHMLISAREHHSTELACIIAAIVSEGSPIRFEDPNSDLRDAVDLVLEAIQSAIPKRFRHGQVQYSKTQRILQQSKKLAAQMHCKLDGAISTKLDSQNAGAILAGAYPDRLAQLRGQGYRLANGQGAQCLSGDPLMDSPWLAVADIQSSTGKQNTIRLAAPISENDIRQLMADHIESKIRVEISKQNGSKVQIKGYKSEMLGKLVLKETRFEPTQEEIQQGLINHIRIEGIKSLHWQEEEIALRAKLAWAHQLEPDIYPNLSDEFLMDNLEDWLQPYMTSNQLADIPLKDALLSQIPWDRQTQLTRDYPDRIQLPSGRDARVDYRQDPPQIQAKLQECFGLTSSLFIGNGRQPVQLALLSPAQKPLAYTMDLPHFWQNVYPDVRKEMRGRYPKHPWPEEPLEAQATAKTKRHLT